jgi:hypothetical protein
MSEFSMIKCDNQGCNTYAPEDEMEGWIRLERREYGDIFDGDLAVVYQMTLVGKTPDKSMQIELPNLADYCCLDCFLKAMRLKE